MELKLEECIGYTQKHINSLLSINASKEFSLMSKDYWIHRIEFLKQYIKKHKQLDCTDKIMAQLEILIIYKKLEDN